MKIAVFGKTGQLAGTLRQYLTGKGHDTLFIDRKDCDLSQSTKTIVDFTRRIPAVNAVIYAAAYTDVEKAEANESTAMAVNANAPSAIAQVCAERDIPLIYISTDYVFDGLAKIPYKPTASTNPINIYGLSKRAGENAVSDSGCRYSILRTSWLYGPHGRNFMTTILKKASDHQEIPVVHNQVGRPTYVRHLAKAIIETAQGLDQKNKGFEGIFHVCDGGKPVSWAGFAKQILKLAENDLSRPIEIVEIDTASLSLKAQRTAYSAMDNSEFENLVGYTLPDWQQGLELAIGEWRRLRIKSNE